MDTASFCPKCGSDQLQATYSEGQIVQKYDCRKCDYEWWQNSKPTVCALILNENNDVLLTKRAIEPLLGLWDVPGGFLENGEDPVVGLKREMKEELGVEIEVGEFVTANVDTYGDVGYFTINLFYLCSIKTGTPTPADDVSDYAWFSLEDLPERIAFNNGIDGLKKLEQLLISKGELA